jgi:acyl-homoserine-lactone acylase
MIPRINIRKFPLACALLSSLLLVACSDSGNNSSGSPYKADIVWTQYGIPHVTARDWGSLGYGLGNAFAQLDFCTYMREVVRANGQSAELLGDDGNLSYDFVMKLYNTDAAIEHLKGELSARGVALFEGYAAGISRFLADTGVENLAQGEEGCRGEPWVRAITLNDVLKSAHKTLLRATADPFYNELVAAVPPQGQLAAFSPPHREEQVAELAQLRSLTPQQVSDRIGFLPPELMGSNAYGRWSVRCSIGEHRL